MWPSGNKTLKWSSVPFSIPLSTKMLLVKGLMAYEQIIGHQRKNNLNSAGFFLLSLAFYTLYKD